MILSAVSSLEDEASGVFCIANSLTKRLKDGGSVDIMKATTHLLSQRSNVIVSKVHVYVQSKIIKSQKLLEILSVLHENF